MELDAIVSRLFNVIEIVGLAVIAYAGWRTKQLAARGIQATNEVKDATNEVKNIAVTTNAITVDTNEKAAKSQEIMEDVRHQTNAMTEQLVQATKARYQLEGEQAGRQQERGTIDEREAERSNLQAERQAERAEDRAERQEMRESWQAHERAEGRRGLPDGEAHE